VFLISPLATILIVLRIPAVRLIYGTDIFSWNATVETGSVLSAFGIGILFQAMVSLLARGFYALHDTKTPVVVSIASIFLVITLDYVFVKVLGLKVWSLALAFSIGSVVQTVSLFLLLFYRKLKLKFTIKTLIPFAKPIFSSLVSALVMFVLLRFFDRYTWIKRLSFLGKLEISKNIKFENFVLDTRYTINLLALTFFVSLIGVLVYLFISFLLKTKELYTFTALTKRIFGRGIFSFLPKKDDEPLTPTTSDTS
jgi:putative peptidoglycan lipid II flippase